MHRCALRRRVCVNSYSSLPVSWGGLMKGTVLALTGCMLLVSAGCAAGQAAGQDSLARPTNSSVRGLDPAQLARNIRAYGRFTRDSFAAYEGQVDEQRLRVCRPAPCHYGPLAVIQPRLGLTDSTSMTRDSGGVIARIINSTDTGYVSYMKGRDTIFKFNLHARDTVYWWAGRINGEPASLFISSKPGVRPMRSNLEVVPHERGTWKQPLARWLWDDKDEEAWATCDGSACCKSKGIPAQ